ncbi:Nodule Cysteine-Rich (NCR) secreted peptide [Medicago truncatula]|uniref:Nodule Cysteine-Rich (NCR) secreted peptide n=2 Tax=Medicago truncatula TaxID=3880 RepID=A0A072UHJ2_MEDTR|nr:Nodule Cysteine-Rich (NCR) secreted peptide [Medicago truncatula]
MVEIPKLVYFIILIFSIFLCTSISIFACKTDKDCSKL